MFAPASAYREGNFVPSQRASPQFNPHYHTPGVPLSQFALYCEAFSRLAKCEKPQFAIANEDFEHERNAENAHKMQQITRIRHAKYASPPL